jgi:GT2 family glycosyltransferase
MSRQMSISVVIPTYKRIPELLRTLNVLSDCDAGPEEVIVHVDGGDEHSGAAVRHYSNGIRVIEGRSTLGPGGSRNKLLKEAKCDIIVSLDDDSFPIDADFFTAVVRAVERHPTAGVIAMNIIHDGEPLIDRSARAHPVSDFVGCGCVYRRQAFLSTRGYVPIQPAYGVEETDMALQIIDQAWDIIYDHDLRVRHATTRSHQASATITAAHISNLALLAFLRYPILYLPLGLLQVLSRIIWSIRNGRISGTLSGIAAIPGKIWQFRSYRKPVSAATMQKVRYLRRESQDIQLGAT